jgi:hypothetical protein
VSFSNVPINTPEEYPENKPANPPTSNLEIAPATMVNPLRKKATFTRNENDLK